MGDKLPVDLLEDVAKRLTYIEDIARFGMVCKSWQSLPIGKHYFQSILSRGSPWLMLTDKNTDDDDNDTRRFFDLSSSKVYNIYLPEARRRRCWGTPYGWLLTYGLDMEIHLLNPLTRARLQLPPQSTFEHQFESSEEFEYTPERLRRYFINSVVLAVDPSSSHDDGNEFIVMVLYHNGALAIAKPGDKSWTSIDTVYAPSRAFEGVGTYFNGQFYVVTTCADICSFDITDLKHPKPTLFAHQPENVRAGEGYYLLEMAGELHFVSRVYDSRAWMSLPENCGDRMTVSFEVYKWDMSTKEWTELKSFDDYALFVGHNSSFSVSVAQRPELTGSCIYFTDHPTDGEYYDIGRDMGVFNLKEETVSPFYLGPDCLSSYSPPIFITPNLW